MNEASWDVDQYASSHPSSPLAARMQKRSNPLILLMSKPTGQIRRPNGSSGPPLPCPLCNRRLYPCTLRDHPVYEMRRTCASARLTLRLREQSTCNAPVLKPRSDARRQLLHVATLVAQRQRSFLQSQSRHLREGHHDGGVVGNDDAGAVSGLALSPEELEAAPPPDLRPNRDRVVNDA